jgi:hypothetical protein
MTTPQASDPGSFVSSSGEGRTVWYAVPLLLCTVLLAVGPVLMFRAAARPFPPDPQKDEDKVAELERRLAQVDLRVQELQRLVSDKPVLRRVRHEEDDGPRAGAALVVYKKWVVVLATDAAVAVVRFTEAPEEGARYQFRCLKKGQTAEEKGEGKVFEKYKRFPGEKPGETVLVDDGGQLLVEAGAVKVEWSYAGDGQGYVYYAPGKVRIYLASPAEFGTLSLRQFMK